MKGQSAGDSPVGVPDEPTRVVPGERAGVVPGEQAGVALRRPADPPTGPARRRWRRIAAGATTGLALLLVLSALLAPNQLDQLTPAAFLRIPAEGLLAVALVLLLPPKPRRVAAALGGAALGLLTVLKIVDMGFFSVLSRPFDPVFDLPLLKAAMGFLTESSGRGIAVAAVITAVVLALALLVLTALAALRLTRPVVGHRRVAGGIVAVLGVGWVACAVLGVQIVPGVPVAAHNYDRLQRVGESLRDRQEFAEAAAVDAFADTPAPELLTALRGKDVVVAFVESYGRDAVEDPDFDPQVGAVLDAGSRRLDRAGFAARSGFLTSPTAGGASWLAHATLLSGLWVDNQQRYGTLLDSDRLTLNRAFQRAGWRTVAVMPGIFEEWPEGEFFGYDQIYAAEDLRYPGPRMNWGIIPDQYTMSAFERFERARADRGPVMAEIPLLSSHVPWTPLAPLLDWDDIGDGSVYDTVTPGGDPPEEVLRDPARTRAAYAEAIGYSLRTLISYVETYGDDDLVLLFLGDHQPARMVTGEGAGKDVPITIVTGDPAVLDRISDWGWQEGLRPDPRAPVWPMDTFRDRFLTAFE